MKNGHTFETRFCFENSLNLFKHEKNKSKYYRASLSLLHPIPQHQSLHIRQQEDKGEPQIPKNPQRKIKGESDDPRCHSLVKSVISHWSRLLPGFSAVGTHLDVAEAEKCFF